MEIIMTMIASASLMTYSRRKSLCIDFADIKIKILINYEIVICFYLHITFEIAYSLHVTVGHTDLHKTCFLISIILR